MDIPPLDNLRDPAWGEPPIPEKFGTLRPLQIDAIRQIVAHFDAGCDVVLLDAPTGLGKTLLADVLRRIMKKSAVYLCNTRTLQEQFQKDFGVEFGGYSVYIQGRSNYATQRYPERFAPDHPERVTCEDCTATPSKPTCEWCDSRAICPYNVAKKTALASPFVCANLQYFLRECNGPATFSGKPIVIADEADQIEGILMGDVQVEISAHRLRRWEIEPLKKGPTPSEAETWIREQVLVKAGEELDDLERRLGVFERDGDDRHPQAVRLRRSYKALVRLYNSLDDDVVAGLWTQTWVAVDAEGGTTFKPVLIGKFGDGRLWRHSARWLLMSATMLNPARLAKDLGIDERKIGVVQMPSSFPVANRPVVLASVVAVNKENTDSGIAARYLAQGIRSIAAAHPKERILVHTVSYALMRAIREHFNTGPVQEGFESRLLWIERSAERDDQLSRFLEYDNSILFGPAMERGLDLPDDACRVIVICKIPFPYLGDAQIAARKRLRDGNEWYINQTLRSLVQMTGRGVRHQDDWCKTYILDRSMEWLLDREGHRLPAWWREALTRQ